MVIKGGITVILFLLLCIPWHTKAQSNLKHAPLQFGFIQNRGQVHDQYGKSRPDILYVTSDKSLKISLKKNGFCYEQFRFEPKQSLESIKENPRQKEGLTQIHRISFELLNANEDVQILAEDIFADPIHYYTDKGALVRTEHFGKVTYKEIYPKTDLVFLFEGSGLESKFKYNFILHPGAKIEAIKIKMEGAEHAEILATGELLIKNSLDDIKEQIPFSYSIANDTKKEEKVQFKLIADGIFGFDVLGDFDGKTLVIDPAPWVSYCGSLGEDIGLAIKQDNNQQIVIAGYTNSATNMVTSGAHQVIAGGLYDGYLAKYTDAGMRLWSTFIGGSNNDYCAGIDIDSVGQIYVIGTSESAYGIASIGAPQDSLKGAADAFIAKFSAGGQRIWGSYWGGEDYDYGNALVRLADGSMGICGGTFSTTGIATNGVYDTVYSAGLFYGDGFVAKIGSAGQKIWGTYYGGTGGDNALSILADSSQNLVVAGYSMSATGLSSTGAHQVNFGGDYDGFLGKFNAVGQLLWGTYYGGTGVDYLNFICLDKQQNIVFGGRSTSDSMISNGSVFQLNYGGGTSWGDGILGKFNASGTRLWSSYFGGLGEETIQGVSVDTSNAIFVCGSSTGSIGFSTSGVHQSNFGGGSSDGFFAKFNSTGNRIWSSYLGGNNVDGINAIQAYPQGSGILLGFSSSSGLATTGTQQTLLSGAPDMILGYFNENGLLPVTFLYVQAQNVLNGIECNWATSFEANNEKFMVERSLDGIQFVGIGEVQGALNSLETKRYRFIDRKPLLGKNYYRIRQIDLDGKYSYSNIISVSNEPDLAFSNWQVKPNPFSGEIFVFPPTLSGIEKNCAVSILDSQGQEVYKENRIFYEGVWNAINLQNLGNGMYFLLIDHEAQKILLER